MNTAVQGGGGAAAYIHVIIFKQTACHLPHEANVEQVFSRASLLTEPGMGPEFLANLVMISINKKAYKPTDEKIKDKYYQPFRGKGGEGMEAEGTKGGEAGPSGAT